MLSGVVTVSSTTSVLLEPEPVAEEVALVEEELDEEVDEDEVTDCEEELELEKLELVAEVKDDDEVETEELLVEVFEVVVVAGGDRVAA